MSGLVFVVCCGRRLLPVKGGGMLRQLLAEQEWWQREANVLAKASGLALHSVPHAAN